MRSYVQPLSDVARSDINQKFKFLIKEVEIKDPGTKNALIIQLLEHADHAYRAAESVLYVRLVA